MNANHDVRRNHTRNLSRMVMLYSNTADSTTQLGKRDLPVAQEKG